MSNFFIRRPIVAIVIAILTVIVGAITIALLPIAQFPNIAPPEIRLQANYLGADAKTLEQSVATPIEQQVTGVDNMEYMYSVNATNGSQTSLLVDFDLKTDPNMDLILTQSRQQLANGQLPPEVNSYGITFEKSTTAPFMLVGFYSPHGTRDATFLSNYAYINLNDPIARSYGVGQSQVFGAGQYAMRLWIKPDQLAKLGITVTDIANAIQAQNTVNPAGQVGGEPAAREAAIHLCGSGAGPPDVAGGIRQHRGSRSSEWRHRARERRCADGAGRAELQHDQPAERQAQRHHRDLPTSGIERRSNRGGRPQADGADETDVSPKMSTMPYRSTRRCRSRKA